MSSERGTYKTVKASFWPCLSGSIPSNLISCPIFARKRGSRPDPIGTNGIPILRARRKLEPLRDEVAHPPLEAPLAESEIPSGSCPLPVSFDAPNLNS